MDTTHFVSALFEHLLREGVQICHWKSNQHLNAALAGRTDLDVLLHEADRESLEAAFVRFGFTQILSPWESRYPGLEDWLGMDPDSGGFVHMHVHYRLLVGSQGVKCFHLPLEKWVLGGLRQVESVPVPRPEIEFVLLILRMNLKLDRRRLRRKSRRNRPGREVFPSAIALEFDWLAGDVSRDALQAALEATGLELDPERVESFVERFRSGELTPTDVGSMRRHVFRAVEPYRSEARPRAFARSQVVRFFKRKGGLGQALFAPRKKRLIDRGRVLALIGADGAGKTTLAEDLRQRLSWKLRVESAYLGIPKTSAVVRVLGWLRLRLKRLRLKHLSAAASAFSWIWIAGTRLRAARRAQRLAARGTLVIADRYPQPEFRSMPEPMDGPRVRAENGGRMTFLASLEQSVYDRIPSATDTFVLTAPLECLHSRKAGTPIEKHRIKVDAVNALALGPERFAIDASQPLESVRLDIAREFWRRTTGLKEGEFLPGKVRPPPEAAAASVMSGLQPDDTLDTAS